MHSQYGRGVLAASPADPGIGYMFLGDALGGRRRQSLRPEESPNGGLANPSVRNCAGHVLTPVPRRGVGELPELAARRAVCVTCGEGGG